MARGTYIYPIPVVREPRSIARRGAAAARPMVMVEALISGNPEAAKTKAADYGNLLPLHSAAGYNGASPEVAQLIYEAYPEALAIRTSIPLRTFPTGY